MDFFRIDQTGVLLRRAFGKICDRHFGGGEWRAGKPSGKGIDGRANTLPSVWNAVSERLLAASSQSLQTANVFSRTHDRHRTAGDAGLPKTDEECIDPAFGIRHVICRLAFDSMVCGERSLVVDRHVRCRCRDFSSRHLELCSDRTENQCSSKRLIKSVIRFRLAMHGFLRSDEARSFLLPYPKRCAYPRRN